MLSNTDNKNNIGNRFSSLVRILNMTEDYYKL